MPSPWRKLIKYLVAAMKSLFVRMRAEIDVDAEFLVDLVTADAAQIVSLRIEEERLIKARAFAAVGDRQDADGDKYP